MKAALLSEAFKSLTLVWFHLKYGDVNLVYVTETRMSRVRQSQGMLRTSRGADLIGSESKRSKSVLIQTCIQYHSIQSNKNDITSLFRPEVCRSM